MKNLKPQQVAPVQREINTTSSEGGTGTAPSMLWIVGIYNAHPFAGDDAE